MIRELTISKFHGGTSSFDKIGPEASASDITFDIFQDPSSMTMPREAVKVSGSTVDNLIPWGVDGSPYDTNKYFYDLGGKIYRETSGGTWSSLRTVSGGAGEGFAIFDDHLYYPTATNLGRYGRLSGTPAFDDALESWWSAAISDLQTTGGGIGATDYTPQTSIAETATHRQTFTATKDPIKEITVNFDVAGTGDYTLTVHDAENRVVGSKTLVNASVVALGDITFTFASQLRTVIGNEYHIHITSTIADGGIDTSTNNDLEAAQFTVEYSPLIDADFHPMWVVEDKLIIGNGPYVAVFDQATYDPNKILLDVGFETRTMTKIDEFVVFGAYKGNSIAEAEAGKLFFWDTNSPSWNFDIDTTSIGAPHALTNTGNKLRGIYGNSGGLYEGYNPFKSIHHRMANLNRNHVLEFYPSSLAGKENITLIATAANATDGGVANNIRKGVYAYGSQEESISDSFVFLYRMSGGNITDDGLKLGFVGVFGSDVYFSEKDSAGNYGVSKVAVDADALTGEASWDSLTFDDGDPQKQFLPLEVIASFAPIVSGESFTARYTDEFGNQTSGTTISEVGATEASVGIWQRMRALTFGVAGTSEGTFPKLTSIKLRYNDLKEEKR